MVSLELWCIRLYAVISDNITARQALFAISLSSELIFAIEIPILEKEDKKSLMFAGGFR